MIAQPGLYLVRGGLKIVAQAGGELVAFDIPMTADELESLAERFRQAVQEWRRLEAAEAGGERPRISKLAGGAPWN